MPSTSNHFYRSPGGLSFQTINRSIACPLGDRLFDHLLTGCTQHRIFCRTSANLQPTDFRRRKFRCYLPHGPWCIAKHGGGYTQKSVAYVYTVYPAYLWSLRWMNEWMNVFSVVKCIICYKNVWHCLCLSVTCWCHDYTAHDKPISICFAPYTKYMHRVFWISPGMSGWKSDLFHQWHRNYDQ